MRKFDLNIEKILENWETKHAIREIIANALDESVISHSQEIKIYKDELGYWNIRDFGRGIQYEHFTQKENDEKLETQGIIGKFGIGLKDALATFERKGVAVRISSRHGDFSIGRAQKSGFDDLTTLHAYISEPSDPIMIGTCFQLRNVSDEQLEQAKRFFLKFNPEKVIESTKYGEILSKSDDGGHIYINGVLVATEANFLLSYNITHINSAIRKAINRERTNVGRTAYTSTVKSLLLESQSEEVAQLLSEDLKGYSIGNIHDELKWIDVQQHAATILNKFQKVVFVTSEEVERGSDLVDEARHGGFEVVTVPENLRDRLQESNQDELENNPNDTENLVRTFTQFQNERSENFQFDFVSPENLNYSERKIWETAYPVFKILGGRPSVIHEILISEVMEHDSATFRPAEGLWRSTERQIIIKRSVLSSASKFIGVLLHEIAHATSGETDGTRGFESELTRLLGLFAAKAIEK